MIFFNVISNFHIQIFKFVRKFVILGRNSKIVEPHNVNGVIFLADIMKFMFYFVAI